MKKMIIKVGFVVLLTAGLASAQSLLVDSRFEGSAFAGSEFSLELVDADKGWVCNNSGDWTYNTTDHRADRATDNSARNIGQIVSNTTNWNGAATLRVWYYIDDDATQDIDFHVSLWGYTGSGTPSTGDIGDLGNTDAWTDDANYTAHELLNLSESNVGDVDYTLAAREWVVDLTPAAGGDTEYEYIGIRVGFGNRATAGETAYIARVDLVPVAAEARIGTLFWVK